MALPMVLKTIMKNIILKAVLIYLSLSTEEESEVLKPLNSPMLKALGLRTHWFQRERKFQTV